MKPHRNFSHTPTSISFKIVVLDDDPTGIQTIHGCYLVTQWDQEKLETALNDDINFFYVLTNSRGKNSKETQRDITEIVTRLLEINKHYEYQLVFICRSDSTLRGHFPLELDCVTALLEDEQVVDGFFLIPAFLEAGRVTMNGTHYLKQGGEYIPVDETEFARDSVFPFSTAYLPGYIQEKTKGKIRAESVFTIDFNKKEKSENAHIISKMADGRWAVVNAEEYNDLDVFTAEVYKNLNEGKNYIFQSSASFVKAFTHNPDKTLIRDFNSKSFSDGLMIVGSHVKKTTEQLNRLLASDVGRGYELDIDKIMGDSDAYLKQVFKDLLAIRAQGCIPIVYTPREERKTMPHHARIGLGKQISSFLVGIVKHIPYPLSWLISKGGITSHDLLTRGLGVSLCRVHGQILPGVSVVRIESTKFPEPLPFIIFPGNVGSEDSLWESFEIIRNGENT